MSLIDRVDVQVRDEQGRENLEPPVDLRQPVFGAALQHHVAVVEEGLQHFLEVHHARRVVGVEHVHVEREARLELGVAEQRFHQHLGVDGLGFRLEHDAHVLIRFVAHVGEQRQLLGLQQFGDLLDQLRLLHLIGDLGDDDLPHAARQFLDRPLGAHAHRTATRLVGLHQRLAAFHEDAARGEVRPRHQVDERGYARVGRLDQMQKCVADLDDVVRRDVRRHADRDAGRAVGEQVGECGRQDDRFFALAIVGLTEIDGVLVEAAHQFGGDLGQARFGVSHRRGVIAVDVAEVPLPVDQRVALCEILREADQRVIDRLVAVRVIFADYVADDARAFLEAGCRIELQLLHRPREGAGGRA